MNKNEHDFGTLDLENIIKEFSKEKNAEQMNEPEMKFQTADLEEMLTEVEEEMAAQQPEPEAEPETEEVLELEQTVEFLAGQYGAPVEAVRESLTPEMLEREALRQAVVNLIVGE